MFYIEYGIYMDFPNEHSLHNMFDSQVNFYKDL